MSMEETIVAIEAALETRLMALPNSPPVAWEDVSFTPITNQQYLSAHHLHNTPRELTINGGPPELAGIFQVSVFYMAGRGRVEAKRLAGRIADLFTPPQAFAAASYRLDLSKAPAVGTGRPDEDGWYMVPVSVYWRAFPDFPDLRPWPKAIFVLGSPVTVNGIQVTVS